MKNLGMEQRLELLVQAAGGGRTDVLQALFSSGVSPDAAVRWRGVQCRPLHVACAERQVDCVRALLKAGAHVDARDGQGRLPLEAAGAGAAEVRAVFQQELLRHVASGAVEAAQALVTGGASAAGCDGVTAGGASMLHWAASFGQSREMLAALMRAGADVGATDAEGRTALHEAAAGGHAGTVAALLDLGCDAGARDSRGRSALDIAVDDATRELLGASSSAAAATAAVAAAAAATAAPAAAQAAAQALAPAPTPTPGPVPAPPLAAQLLAEGRMMRPSDEVMELRRLNEEKDMTIVALRGTVETLLEKNGVLKEIQKLQDDYRALQAVLQRCEDQREHLQSLYQRCDSELDKTLKETAELRAALQARDERLQGILSEGAAAGVEEATAVPPPLLSPPPPLLASSTTARGPADGGSGGGSGRSTPTLPSPRRESEMLESLETIRLERDRLALELETERRLRFSEARLHLGHAAQMRQQLKEAQAAHKSMLVTMQPRVVAGQLRAAVDELSKATAGFAAHQGSLDAEQQEAAAAEDEGRGQQRAPRSPRKQRQQQQGYISSFLSSIFGDDDSDDDSDESDAESQVENQELA
jgi:hypothetical protein